MRFPCDKFNGWEDNLRAIALTLEHLRAVDRYGVTSHNEQYKGWTGLPDRRTVDGFTFKTAAIWIASKARDVLGAMDITEYDIETKLDRRQAIYKRLVVRLHPDVRGTDMEFKQLQQAMEAFEQ